MKKVAGKLKLAHAQFRELQAFAQFATDVDEATRKRILQGQKINEVLKQSDQDPMPVEEQVCIFYAVLNNYFENVAVEDITKTEGDALGIHFQAARGRHFETDPRDGSVR